MKVRYPGPAVEPAVAVTKTSSYRFGVELQAGQAADGSVVPVEVEVPDEFGTLGIASGTFLAIDAPAPVPVPVEPSKGKFLSGLFNGKPADTPAEPAKE